ncbi:unnamed protein product [Amoebophrya sp. A25]|nr:unnamed protein product [Amoebophrya sp. A25]|eukprot:GSA25T00017616001.1
MRVLFEKNASGNYTYAVSESELHIPPRLHEFFLAFVSEVEEATPDFLSPDYSPIVEEQDKENRGCGLPNFLSDPVFRLLFNESFEATAPTAVWSLAEKVHEYMTRTVCRLVADVAGRDFPRLHQSLQSEVMELTEELLQTLRTHLEAVLDSERGCVLTLDEPGFQKLIDEMNLIVNASSSRESNYNGWLQYLASFGIKNMEDSTRQQQLRDLRTNKPRIFHMQVSLAAYTKLVQRQLFDRVAKLCQLFFVSRFQERFDETLTTKDLDFVIGNMQQDRRTVERRRQAETSLKRLKRCRETLDSLTL